MSRRDGHVGPTVRSTTAYALVLLCSDFLAKESKPCRPLQVGDGPPAVGGSCPGGERDRRAGWHPSAPLICKAVQPPTVEYLCFLTPLTKRWLIKSHRDVSLQLSSPHRLAKRVKASKLCGVRVALHRQHKTGPSSLSASQCSDKIINVYV
eukprot:scaffold97719_cov37-Prasinocladus_malaysianus.AAC.1